MKSRPALSKLLLSWQLQNGQYRIYNIDKHIIATIWYNVPQWYFRITSSIFSSREEFFQIMRPEGVRLSFATPNEALYHVDDALKKLGFRFVPTKALVLR